MPVLLPVHIVAGMSAIVLGALALLARKGALLHRRVGLVFVYATVTMGLTGSILALRQSLTNSNVLGGVTTIYFVGTALMTVRPTTRWTRPLTTTALVVAIALVIIELVVGAMAFASPDGMLNNVPFAAYWFLAAVTGVAAVGDGRLLRTGRLGGGPRLSRHLWRMCYALFIATASFFSIRARVARIFPAPLTTPLMRTLPILLVLVAMAYWLWKVRKRDYSILRWLADRMVGSSPDGP